MELIGYKEWNQIFNLDLSKIWQEERKELQTTAVLLGALKFELNKVQVQLEGELEQLRKKCEQKEVLQNEMKGKRLSPRNTNIQKNEVLSRETKSKGTNNKENNFKSSSIIESPDLFKLNESIVNTSENFIDLSISDDDTSSVGNNNDKYVRESESPKLTKSKKPYQKKKLSQELEKLTQAKKDIFKTPGKSDGDETFINHSQFNKAKTKPTNCQVQNFGKNESSSDLLNEIDELLNIPTKKKKLSSPEPEPVIRGKARRILMKGTTCKDCINFYGSMDLPPDQLKKIINQCSNHRYVHQPREETMPGYWDLSFPDV